VVEDEATRVRARAGSGHATNESGLSSRRCKRKYIDDLCLYILELFEYCIVELFYNNFACICFFFLHLLAYFLIINYENMLNLVRICWLWLL
jgi:hypothetical protein